MVNGQKINFYGKVKMPHLQLRKIEPKTHTMVCNQKIMYPQYYYGPVKKIIIDFCH